MLEGIISGWQAVLNPQMIVLLILCIPLGIVVGVMPGLGAVVGITVLLPLTFGMEPLQGVCMLVAIYCASFYGGAVSAILINTPGTPAAICTLLDGHPMARRGEAHKALTAAVVASTIGGVLSVILLTFCAPVIAKVALKFRYTEYFAISVFGIIMVISSSSKKTFLKGLITGTIGLFLATVGQDKMGTVERFTFDVLELSRGLPLLPVVVGLFAVSQALTLTEQGAKAVKLKGMDQKAGLLNMFMTMARHKMTLIKSSLIGTGIGAIPGTGAAISSFVAYSEAKRASGHPETYGKGEIDGIIAAESSNNSVTGGALIPLLSLGIPGDPITAIMLGAFLVHGLIPGPMLFIESSTLVYAIFAAMLLAYLLILAYGYFFARPFAALLKVREAILVPIILVVSFIGAYAVNSSIFDVGIAFVFGIVGYLLTKFDFPLPPILMGIILGPIAEESLRQSLMVSEGSWSILVTQPISAFFLLITAIIVLRKVYLLVFSKEGKTG